VVLFDFANNVLMPGVISTKLNNNLFSYLNAFKIAPLDKALQNWKISVKALSKQLWKLIIRTTQLQ